jgi:cytochrome c oxidase subunit IV
MDPDHQPSMKAYIGLWIIMILIAALEVFLTYQHLDRDLYVALLLILAFVEAGLAMAYFMHLRYERRNLFWTLVPITVFTLVMLDHIWPDAHRLARLYLFR